MAGGRRRVLTLLLLTLFIVIPLVEIYVIVQVGQVIGNDYVLLGGLKAGDKLIVSGIQKIGDGAPVTAMPARGAGAGPASPKPAGPAEAGS